MFALVYGLPGANPWVGETPADALLQMELIVVLFGDFVGAGSWFGFETGFS